MKDGKRLSPAFAKAQDDAELRLRQQIDALTEPQRKDYDALRRRQKVELAQQRQTKHHQEQRQIAERTERYLWRRDPGLRPHGLAPRRDALSMDNAVEGAMRRSEAAQVTADRLKDAQSKARRDVARAQAHAIEQTRARHARERKTFLDRAERDRYFPAGKEYRDRPDAPERTWHDAFMESLRAEQDRKNDRDRGRDRTRDR